MDGSLCGHHDFSGGEVIALRGHQGDSGVSLGFLDRVVGGLYGHPIEWSCLKLSALCADSHVPFVDMGHPG